MENEEEWDKFARWAKESIQISEEDLGRTFPDDFKELFE